MPCSSSLRLVEQIVVSEIASSFSFIKPFLKSLYCRNFTMLFRERASRFGAVAEGSGERETYCFEGDEGAGPEPWPEGLHFFKRDKQAGPSRDRERTTE